LHCNSSVAVARNTQSKREILHAPENTPEVRLILWALPLRITYDVAQQSVSTILVLFLFRKKKEIKKDFFMLSVDQG
jgi:hypothetical protein